MRDLAFGLIWIVALPSSFVSPFAGVLLWVWVALIAPNQLLYGILSGVPFNKTIAITTTVFFFINKEKKDVYFDLILKLLFLFGLLAIITFFFSGLAADSNSEIFEKLIKALVLAFLISMTVTTRYRIHLVIVTVVMAFSLISSKEGMIALFTGGGHKIEGYASVGDNNALATTLLMIVPLAYYLARYSALKIVRFAMFTVIVLSIVTIVMTYSRGGFVGLIILCGMMIRNSRYKLSTALLALVMGGLIISFAPEAWFARLQTIDNANSDDSFIGRVVAWKISLLIALNNPLTGGGFHAVQSWPVWLRYAPYLSQVNFYPTPKEADFSLHAAHSIYFEVLGDMGFIGFATFVGFLLMSLINCGRVYRLAKKRPSLTWAADLARMLQISMVCYAVTGALLSQGYFELMYVLVTMTSRLLRTVRQTIEAEAGNARVPVPAVGGGPIRTAAFPTPLGRPRLRPGLMPRPSDVPMSFESVQSKPRSR